MSTETTRRTPDASPRRVPGEVGVWLFLFGDMLVFAACFVVFVTARDGDTQLFERSRDTLHVAFGAVNTVLLVTGSRYVARGIQAIHEGVPERAPRCFVVAIATGLLFGVDKVVEWSSLLADGHTPASNDFYMYFFAFTAMHFVHLVVGVAVLTYMHRTARRPRLTRRQVRNLESGATYWHLVDLLWIALFALLYLV